jgi:hypothetical protein
MTVFDRILQAVALAHQVPGVTLELQRRDADPMIVASHRLDADLDPCGLRAALVTARRHLMDGRSDPSGTGGPVGVIEDVAVSGGLVDLGGGLHQRHGTDGTDGTDERWFTTTLDHRDVGRLLALCPPQLPHDEVSVRLSPDAALGVTVVRMTVDDPSAASSLDAAAFWALATCMVEELLQSAGSTVDR